MSDQQLGFLTELVDVAKQQSDTLMVAVHELKGSLVVKEDEREMLERMKNSQNKGNTGITSGFGEQNESVKDFLGEMGRRLLDDMERPLEDLEAGLQRVQTLTQYFSEYAGALLPTGHHNESAKGKDDKRLLGKYRQVRDQVYALRTEVLELAVEENAAAQTVDRLERQAKIDVGGRDDNAAADKAADKKAKDREAKAEARLEQARKDRDDYKKDYQEAVKRLSAVQEVEKDACNQLQQQMAQFEFDRAEFMELALGDLFHGGISYHAQALQKYARLCEYAHTRSGRLSTPVCPLAVPPGAMQLTRSLRYGHAACASQDDEMMEMVPDDIESDTHFLKKRPAQGEAQVAMASIKTKAAEAQAAELEATGRRDKQSAKATRD